MRDQRGLVDRLRVVEAEQIVRGSRIRMLLAEAAQREERIRVVEVGVDMIECDVDVLGQELRDVRDVLEGVGRTLFNLSPALRSPA